jgi:glycosyltransferase involved in cell wall biosynthesis
MPTEAGPRVTIITPVYNAERYVERCMRSALAQTVPDWEMIVVDDGSTDRTPDLVRSFSDPRIRYLPLPHRGLTALAESYNAALDAAKGDLIAILEGDDTWPADKLEKQLPSFDDAAVVLSWGRGVIVDEDDVVSHRWPIRREWRRTHELPELFRILTRWNILSPSLTVMIRKSALEQIGGFQQGGSRLFIDLPTWLMLSARVTGKARYVNADLGYYRIHETGTGITNHAAMRIEHYDVASTIMREIGADRLRQLGWSAADERDTAASAALTRGMAYFERGDRKQARDAFRTTLRSTRSGRESFKALLGYGSAVTGLDLFRIPYKLKASAAALSLRIRS